MDARRFRIPAQTLALTIGGESVFQRENEESRGRSAYHSDEWVVPKTYRNARRLNKTRAM